MSLAITLLGGGVCGVDGFEFVEVVRLYNAGRVNEAMDKLGTINGCSSGRSKALIAQADDLDQNWTTTGYYQWDEMARAIHAIIGFTTAASSAASNALHNNWVDGLVKARDDYFEYAKGVLKYNEIWQNAKPASAIIDAPTFKAWCVGLLHKAAIMMRWVEVMSCMDDWWAPALSAVISFARAVFDVCMAIGKAVVAVAQAVVHAGRDLVVMWPYLKWGGIIFGALVVGVFAYNKLESVAASGRKPIDWSALRAKFKRKPKAQVAGRR